MSEKTLGERRVRTDFNVSAKGEVDQIKQKSAELIDLVKGLPRDEAKPMDTQAENERQRLISLAITAYEEAAMWAVKAATA
jgi:hypothetical protein